jgi:hypothetical protein
MDFEMESEPDVDWRDNSGYSDVERYSDGSYKSFLPANDTEWMLDGRTLILAAGHRVRFFTNGQLQSCVVAAKASIDVFGTTAVLAADSALAFHASGVVRTFTLGSLSSWIPWVSRAWKYRGVAYNEGATLHLSEDGAIAS